MERILAQTVSFIVTMILARILAPSDYGIVAIVTLFLTFANVIVTMGLESALVQKIDADEVDFSTVFWINIFTGIVVYVIFFLLAPIIASYYEYSELKNMLRVAALQIPIMSVNAIQQAYVARNMQFRKFFYATLIGTIISAFVGVLLAVLGYGGWALIFQSLTNVCVDTFVLSIIVGWHPKMIFQWDRAKPLMKYGYPLLMGQIIWSAYDEARGLIIGKKFHASELAFYNKGNQIPMIFVISFDLSINSVLFSALSKIQNDKDLIVVKLKKAIGIATFIIAPVMLGLISSAKCVIEVLFSEKWLPCVPYLRICCVAYLMYGTNVMLIQGLKSVGKSKEVFIIQALHKIIMLPIIFASIKYGVLAIVLSEIISYVLQILLAIYMSKKHLGYGLFSLVRDIYKNLLQAILMGAGVFIISFLKINTNLLFAIEIICGFLMYVLMSVVFNNSNFNELISMIKMKITKNSIERGDISEGYK